MNSKYAVLAIAFLILGSVPFASATTGTYSPPASVAMSGPLVDKVVFSVCADSSTCADLLSGGSIQGAELAFSVGAWTSLCPPPNGTGSDPSMLCGKAVTYTWVGVAFNYVKFPGDNVNFRRAMEFLQDYSYIQNTILQGVLGQATDQPTPCFAYPTACNPAPMTAHYGTAQNLVAAGEELEMVTDGTASTTLYCDNGGVQCNGAYASTSEWCLGAIGTGSGCGTGHLFAPLLDVGSNYLYKRAWDLAISYWASEIGLQVGLNGGGQPAVVACDLQEEVQSPGVYNPLTGYNSDPVLNSTWVAQSPCAMATVAAYSPSLQSLMQSYNSRFAGSTPSLGNVYDDPAFVSASDSVAGYSASTPHATVFNLDYTTNELLFAATQSQVNSAAQDFMNAYALQVPSVMGYYTNTLYADNANGWTGFAQEPLTGPNELGGLRYSFLNVHQCGSATCTIGVPDGGAFGGTLNFALSNVADASGLNPLYQSNWPWQEDVYDNIYDTPLTVAPTGFTGAGDYVDYMTTSHVVKPLTLFLTGAGPTWFYFQQPCANPASPHYSALEANCQGRSGPDQVPGPLQHGMGLRLGQRLIMNGERITLNFRNDVYFSDGAEVYADDYLFSLNLFNVAGSPNLPDTSSPYSGVGGGPEGLIAAQMLNSHSGPCAVHCPTINLFFGSQSVSNLADVIVPVLPSHIWRFFNPDHVCTVAQGCLDTTRPISCTATIRGPVTCSPSFVLTIPKPVYWSWFLPNVEIGSGPFWLHNWNGTAGTGEIDANPSYFNANWTAMADLNPQTLPYTLSASLLVPVFNPTKVAIQCGPASPGKIPPGATGMCQITNAATGPNELKVYDGRGTLWRNLKVVRNPLTGVYSATIPAGLTTVIGHPCGTPSATCFKMPPGQYRAVLQAKYTFHGQPRTWHQVFGFTIS